MVMMMIIWSNLVWVFFRLRSTISQFKHQSSVRVTSEWSVGSQGHQSFCLPCGTQQSVRVRVSWCSCGGCSLICGPISQRQESRAIWTGNSCGLWNYGCWATVWDDCAGSWWAKVRLWTKKRLARGLLGSLAPTFHSSPSALFPLSEKIACAIGAIKRIRHLTPFNVLIKFYNSFIQPHFDYCNVVGKL